jgi:photosystem II stability/assembly factor-like uncharacterized protein
MLTKRTDGWSWVYNNWPENVVFYDGKFVDSRTAIIVGGQGIILKTTDAGASWTKKRNAQFLQSLRSVSFSGTQAGIAVGDGGVIVRTTDGGETWTAISQFIPNNLTGVFMTSSAVAHIVGSQGYYAKSTDGGNSWVPVSMNTINNFKDIYFANASVGYIVGNAGGVFKTTDGGSTWGNIYNNSTVDFNTVYFTSPLIGYAGATNRLMMTTDGGNTWTSVSLPVLPSQTVRVFNFTFPVTSTGFAVGDLGYIFQTSDGGNTWTQVIPYDKSITDVKRYHPETNLPENGIGLGGAIYILDQVTLARASRADSIRFDRVRIQNNSAYTGAAIYSDNYGLALVLNRSLITNNTASSGIGMLQNVITSAFNGTSNYASSDLAGTILYGDIQGPLPIKMSSEAANSIYENSARFLVRTPDAPNTKGILAGTTGIGIAGTDTLMGNYWGETQANVTMLVENNKGLPGINNQTFFVDTDGASRLPFMHTPDGSLPITALLQQGPFESINVYSYTPIPLRNLTTENDPDIYTSIPEKLLFSGRVYDGFDKGTDIKLVDYSQRRMSPIEDFAVGIPRTLKTYSDPTLPSFGKYVKRWLHDPFVVEDPAYNQLSNVQGEFGPDSTGMFYHPIGYPVYLETQADYTTDPVVETNNDDPRLQNETVFFAINETTGDFIRINLRQVNETNQKEIYRTRFDLVPDSTLRSDSTTVRRIHEGLKNFGSGKPLLAALEHNPYNEDKATLQGRKWEASITELGNYPKIFKNRPLDVDGNPTMPASNNGTATFFGGERYQTLPVNVGDSVYIVSRTILWSEGFDIAKAKGIYFTVTNSTRPPIFTGDIDSIKARRIISIVPSQYPWKRAAGILDTIWNDVFRNTVFVTEDRFYPQSPGTYSGDDPSDPNVNYNDRGRDSIFSVTAIDLNNFYDPRSYLEASNYARLTYRWTVDPTSALAQWLQVDTVHADGSYGSSGIASVPRYGAYGYLIFKGHPINPFIVPGGETVKVEVDNYPPHYRIIDSLRSMVPPLPESVIAKYMNNYKPYFNASAYDAARARYLQQDTVDNGANFTTYYDFKLFVVDSVPRFIPINTPPNGIYLASDYRGGLTAAGKVIANVTDKLRLMLDFNTDDELEDASVAATWDYRFGKTAYGFMNVAARSDEEVNIDTTFTSYQGNTETLIYQTRPIWMSNQYIYKYGGETAVDPFARDFTTMGQLNIRIDRTEADNLLKPVVFTNGGRNTDTMFTVIANDGHGGFTKKLIQVFVNFSPTITTQSLPDAKEDFEYNSYVNQSQLLDSSKMIKVYDPNFEQQHRFELIYPDDSRTLIAKDPLYSEAGNWDLTNLKTTPKWLHINPVSGMLYGKPGVKDAPRGLYGAPLDTITVLVWDMVDGQRALPTIKVLYMNVDSTNHKPHVLTSPDLKCVDMNKPYKDTVLVYDRDLLRVIPGPTPLDFVDALVIRVLAPVGIQALPTPYTGNGNDSTFYLIISSVGNLSVTPEADGRITIKIEVRDKSGLKDTLIYRLKVSDPTDFICPITIANNAGEYRTLEFGHAKKSDGATTGYGLDGEAIGTLDYNFCEYELPPPPQPDILDARWTIPNTMGTSRNIYPEAETGVIGDRRFRARFHAGGDGGSRYPVTISWLKSDVPTRNAGSPTNPTSASWWLQDAYSAAGTSGWSINMNTGDFTILPNVGTVTTSGDTCTLTITDQTFQDFVIVHDWETAVTPPVAGNITSIVSVTPNPFNDATNINFNLLNDSKATLDVIDNLGNVVATITSGDFTQGEHRMQWDAKDQFGKPLASGTYTCRLICGSVVTTYPMLIVK